jgi:uncharacterized Tic20 family protein
MIVETAPNADERTWGMYAHLSGMLAFTAVPFGGIIGPLVLYLQNKPTRPFATEQAREALNFHITVGIFQLLTLIGGIVAWFELVLSASLSSRFAPVPVAQLTLMGACFGGFFLVYIWTFVLTLVGTIRSSSGSLYRYPLTIRFVRAAP